MSKLSDEFNALPTFDRWAVDPYRQPAPARKSRYDLDPDCAWCQRHKGQGPAHGASPKCESGGHAHCTCDTCF